MVMEAALSKQTRQMACPARCARVAAQNRPKPIRRQRRQMLSAVADQRARELHQQRSNDRYRRAQRAVESIDSTARLSISVAPNRFD